MFFDREPWQMCNLHSIECDQNESCKLRYAAGPKPTLKSRVRIVKNELGGSATQHELRGVGTWRGYNGMNRGTGGLTPPSIRTLLKSVGRSKKLRSIHDNSFIHRAFFGYQNMASYHCPHSWKFKNRVPLSFIITLDIWIPTFSWNLFEIGLCNTENLY